jgi:hypothetical protein
MARWPARQASLRRENMPWLPHASGMNLSALDMPARTEPAAGQQVQQHGEQPDDPHPFRMSARAGGKWESGHGPPILPQAAAGRI